MPEQDGSTSASRDPVGRAAEPPRKEFASSRRGQVFTNPVTGERAVLLTDPETHPDRVLVAQSFVRPGGRVAAPHVHPGPRSAFTCWRLGSGSRSAGRTGHSAPVSRGRSRLGTLHDWWQIGAEEAQVLVEVTPDERFVRLVATTFGLARDGRVDARGLPHVLQAAVSMTAYRDTIVFASPPRLVQRLLFGGLAPLGRLLGKQPVYPEYLFSADLAEPHPEVLALLDEQGRLRLEPASEGST
jgi:hypothetical protein